MPRKRIDFRAGRRPGDGRMTISVTNRTRHPLRVVLPPGSSLKVPPARWAAWAAWAAAWAAWAVAWAAWAVAWAAWAVAWAEAWVAAWADGMGGMGSMGRSSGTMPATMGMMMLARIIMYFCGDPESWDMRSLMIGMMGSMAAAWAAWAAA